MHHCTTKKASPEADRPLSPPSPDILSTQDERKAGFAGGCEAAQGSARADAHLCEEPGLDERSARNHGCGKAWCSLQMSLIGLECEDVPIADQLQVSTALGTLANVLPVCQA